MAFSESLAARIREALGRRQGIVEKKMFGGAGFLLRGNMLVGVWKDSLIVRLGREQGPAALKKPHVRAFDVTGKPMQGWVMVDPDGLESDDGLKAWIDQALDFVKTLPPK